MKKHMTQYLSRLVLVLICVSPFAYVASNYTLMYFNIKYPVDLFSIYGILLLVILGLASTIAYFKLSIQSKKPIVGHRWIPFLGAATLPVSLLTIFGGISSDLLDATTPQLAVSFSLGFLGQMIFARQAWLLRNYDFKKYWEGTRSGRVFFGLSVLIYFSTIFARYLGSDLKSIFYGEIWATFGLAQIIIAATSGVGERRVAEESLVTEMKIEMLEDEIRKLTDMNGPAQCSCKCHRRKKSFKIFGIGK